MFFCVWTPGWNNLKPTLYFQQTSSWTWRLCAWSTRHSKVITWLYSLLYLSTECWVTECFIRSWKSCLCRRRKISILPPHKYTLCVQLHGRKILGWGDSSMSPRRPFLEDSDDECFFSGCCDCSLWRWRTCWTRHGWESQVSSLSRSSFTSCWIRCATSRCSSNSFSTSTPNGDSASISADSVRRQDPKVATQPYKMATANTKYRR